MSRLDIVVLNWNTTDHTIECIDSLRRQTFKDFRMVLVDNGSLDDQYEKLRKYFKKSGVRGKVLRLKSNRGYASGENYGASKCSADFIMFLNNDVVLDRDFLRNMFDSVERHPDHSVFIPKALYMMNGRRTKIMQHAGSRLTYYGATPDRSTGFMDGRRFDDEVEERCITGPCFMVSRKMLGRLEEIFCDYYFTYFEDADLGWRIRSAGGRMMFVPTAVVNHKGSVSIKVNKKVSTQDMFTVRNKYLTYWRNLRMHDFLLVLPLMLGYDLFRICKHMAGGNPMLLVNFLVGFGKFLGSLDKVKVYRRGRLSDLSW